MDWLQLLQYGYQYGPLIKSIFDEAVSNDDFVTKIQKTLPGVAPILEQVGAQAFPEAAPAIHIVGAAVAAFDTNTTKWLQKSLNAYLGLTLAVDGVYGSNTKAAVKQAQQKLGITVDGLAGKITQGLLDAAMGKLAAAQA